MYASFITLLFLGWFESLSAVRAPKPPEPAPHAPATIPVPAYELRIDGEIITLRADDVPLTTILAGFVQAGIRVMADPSVDARISGHVKDMPVDQALEKLLGPYGYVLIWKVIPGPVGRIEQLDEVHVFPREGPRRLEEFMPDDQFRVTRGPAPGGPEFVADEILLALRPGVDIDQFRTLLAQIGATVIDSVPGLGIYRLRLPLNTNIESLVRALEANQIVSRVEPNYAYRLPPPPERFAADRDANATRPSVTTMVPAAVAVLDSGIRAISSLEGLAVGGFDAVRPERAVDDTAGHGTQMALIASGAIVPAGAAASEAGVPVLGIRAFDDHGYTSNFTLMRAIEHAAAQGARVINLSWGSTTPSSFLRTAVQKAQDDGMAVVASAGNDPSGAPVYPASYPGVISVSALQPDGTPWSQSNFGEYVDVAAPGTAQFPVGYEGPPGGYAGTSIAAAYVSRHLALYFAAHPDESVADAQQALYVALTPLAPASGKYGRGALDNAALERWLAPR